MNAAAMANMPLPAGWEAKYDPGQRRYFFINHATKQTSWEDPRAQLYQQQQHQHQLQQQQYHPQPAASTIPSWQQASPHRTATSQPASNQPEAIRMNQVTTGGWQQEVQSKYGMTVQHVKTEDESEQAESEASSVDLEDTFMKTADPKKFDNIKKIFPSVPNKKIKQLLAQHKNVEGLVIMELEKEGHERRHNNAATLMLMKLRAEYPLADDALLKGFISSADGDEQAVRLQLEEMGYTKKVTVVPSPTRAAPAQTHTAPAAPAISDAKKQSLKTQFASEFSSCSATVIEMALEACAFDESKTRSLLKSMSTTTTGPAMSTSHQASTSTTPVTFPSSTTNYTYTPSSSVSTSTAASVPVSFPDPVFHVSSAFSASTSRTSAGSSTTTATKKTTAKTSRPAHGKKKTQERTSPAKTRTTGAALRSAGGAYHSENRCTPQGANPEFAAGPNKDLLIREYTSVCGPDPGNTCGPDPTLTHGKGVTLASGSDPTLVEGANEELARGPNWGDYGINRAESGGVCGSVMNVLCLKTATVSS